MSVKITSDSTCDLSPELIEQLEIGILPLTVVLDDQGRLDGQEISPSDIFRHVDAGGELPTTSAVSVAEYLDAFTALRAQYDEVIHINLGSGFSACYQNACLAAQELEGVYPVDSQNLSSGQGHVVVAAAQAAKAGKTAAEICSMLEDLIPRVEASFIIDRLDYMVKGGRCSAVTMLGANLLRLKPCIEVKNGAMGVVKKYRGSFEKCLQAYVKDRLEGRDDIVTDRIFITHPACPHSDVELTRSEIEKYQRFSAVTETHAGCTVSCHCGPRTLGILFLRSK